MFFKAREPVSFSVNVHNENKQKKNFIFVGRETNTHQYGQVRQRRWSYFGNGLQKGLQRQQQLCDQLIFQESYLKFANLNSS